MRDEPDGTSRIPSLNSSLECVMGCIDDLETAVARLEFVPVGPGAFDMPAECNDKDLLQIATACAVRLGPITIDGQEFLRFRLYKKYIGRLSKFLPPAEDPPDQTGIEQHQMVH
jgi:hypothetical protein